MNRLRHLAQGIRRPARARAIRGSPTTGGRYGLQTMCEGGGTANVTIIERL